MRIEEELKRKRADLIVVVEQLTLRIETVKKQVSAIDQVIAIYDPAHQASSAVKPNRKQASLVLSAARGRRIACAGPRLRAAYIENAQSFLTYSLAPTTTVGLIPNDAPANGPTKSLVLRWDAEWMPHVFTALEYQRQTLQDLSIPRINTLSLIDDLDEARSEWLAATVNVWLGHGIGVFGKIGGATSEILEGQGQGEPVPYIPDQFARAGVTFVHPSRLRFTLTQNYIGKRTGSYENDRLDAYWTTDAAFTWATPDRHFQFGVTALNLFDQDYEFGFYIPAPGRTIAATIKARL